jgi:hypothetical protein
MPDWHTSPLSFACAPPSCVDARERHPGVTDMDGVDSDHRGVSILFIMFDPRWADPRALPATGTLSARRRPLGARSAERRDGPTSVDIHDVPRPMASFSALEEERVADRSSTSR